MKVLWILNSPIGEISNVLELNRAQSGTWIDAAMESLVSRYESLELTILTTASIPQELRKTVGNVTYICIPAGKMLRGKRTSKKNLFLWQQAVGSIKPDLIHIWGTEFSLGYDLKKIFSHIPVVYTMQGVMSYISRYPYHCFQKMKQNIGFFSKIKCIKYQIEQRKLRQQAILEQQMIADADGIIADNEWAISPFLSKETADKFHFIKLPIKQQFQNTSWVQENAQEHTLFCIAGRSGLKGIHQVVEAANLLKQDFPNLKILIPGNISSKKPAFVFAPPYVEYLKNLIASYRLEENIQFLGQLSTPEMISYMKQAKIFIMPSAIENESSTLREAMFLGMPVITSCVGDIFETVVHGENGLLYRFEEFEMLSYFIRKLLEDPQRAAHLGQNAASSMRDIYSDGPYGAALMEVYRKVTR